MTPINHDRWRLVEELFHAAQSQPPESRSAWVDTQGQVPADVRDEVKSLLAGFEAQEGLSCAVSLEVETEEESLPGARFGPYQLIELLGRGGMGAVYLARRADGQFDQTVALKTMASHLSVRDFLKRFQTERQLLASL